MGEESAWDELKDLGEGTVDAVSAVGDGIEAQLETGADVGQAGADWLADTWSDVGNAAEEIGQSVADAVGGAEPSYDDGLPERSRPGPFPF